MECLKLLRDKDGLGQSVFVPLVNHIQKCEMEIVSDQEYLKQVNYPGYCSIIQDMGELLGYR